MEVECHSGFRADLDEVINFYLERAGVALADAFINEVVDALDRIEADPERFLKIRGSIRRCRLQRFRAYAVFYKYDRNLDRLFIGALIHGARHPKTGFERFRQ